jgi:spore germination protein GerM
VNTLVRVVIPALFFVLALVAGVGMWYLSGMGQSTTNPLLATQGSVPRPVPVGGAPEPITPTGPTTPAAESTDGALVVSSRSESRQVVLYVLTRGDLTKLVPHTLAMDSGSGTRDLVDRVVNALQGPFEDPNLIPTLPKGTKLLSVFTARKQLLVNLSRDVQVLHPGGTMAARMTIYSLVNTLIDLGIAEEVRIMIQGREEPAFMDHLDLTRPLVFDSSITQGKVVAMEPEPEKPKGAASKLSGATAAAAGAKGGNKR